MPDRKRTQSVLVKRQCPPGDACSIVTTTTYLAATKLSPTSFIPSSSSDTIASTTTTTTPSSSASAAVSSSSSNAGTIAGSVVGGVIFLVSLIISVLLYLRARKRRRTPPSSEFINSIKDGGAPVLRLDSGAEFTPALAEKGCHTHYPPSVPLPFLQNSYYSAPSTQNMKFPDDLMISDIPSQRPSVEKPLHPQRLSSQRGRDSFVLSTSVGSKRELWGSETEIACAELLPVRESSPRADSILQFAPRFSLNEPPSQTVNLSNSRLSLQPLRRQPD